MQNNEQKLTQKTWFRNTVLIVIPTVISAIGVVISLAPIKSQTLKISLIAAIAVLMIVLAVFVFMFSKQDDELFEENQKLKRENNSLAVILAHMENEIKTRVFTITALSEMAEKWAKNINSFSNNVLNHKQVSDKNWDKIKYFDLICVQCKKMIMQYCNNDDGTKVSVGFISYREENGEKIIHMISHSNPESTRPNACKKEEKLLESTYHYAELIKDEYSDIEVAVNNEEVRRIFRSVSKTTDLSKYAQYIAVPVYCTSNKLLGIFQIVTKYDYIIEQDKVELLKFAEESIVPYSNLIVLVDKINKGLYINPGTILKEE